MKVDPDQDSASTTAAARESPKELQRRAWVERQERFKDANEEYERDLVAARPEDRRALTQAFSDKRKAHREEDIRAGKRAHGLSVSMRQNMWARWIEVAVEHELAAREAYHGILANPNSDNLIREFHASLVATTATAYTVEAVFGDIKYLIPIQPGRKRNQRLRNAFRTAFGTSGPADEQLAGELRWLFTLRDSAAHPYTESVAPARHPAGINTGVEHSHFNAVTSGRAVDTAMAVLDLAASPLRPSTRWIERWVGERAGHRPPIEQLKRHRDENPLPT